MFDRMRATDGRVGKWSEAARAPRRATRPRVESMEDRQLLTATLAPIPAVNSPTQVGTQIPLQGGADNQTYTVSSSNPLVKASITQGKFLTINVSHSSSGANDPAFTGSLVFQLFDDLTPLTTAKIEGLVTQGFYDGNDFHRILANFPGTTDYIEQAGSVDKQGGGNLAQAGFPFPDEFNPTLVFSNDGLLAMANSGPDTNSSQFFLSTGQPRFLDFHHTIFAQLVAGSSTAAEISRVAANSAGLPTSTVTITTARLSNVNPNGNIHVDTTQAPVGSTATLTIRATDSVTGDSTTRTTTVNVTNDLDESGNAVVERPYLNNIPNQTVGAGQTLTYQLPAVNVQNQPVIYTVAGGVTQQTSSTGVVNVFVPVNTLQVAASVNQAGVLTVVPVPNLPAGTTITLVAGVGLANPPSSIASSATSIGNFEYHTFTVTFNGATASLTPIANVGGSNVTVNTPANLQLSGTAATAGQALTYALASQPNSGTITNFNASTGSFTYTPQAGFLGADAFTFTVSNANGQTSPAQTFFLDVVGANTQAVRTIDTTLIVTPPPRTDGKANNIRLAEVNGNIQTTLNGVIDTDTPTSSSIDRVIVYGSKASDNITIDPSITQQVTLDGGHGGTNVLQAGAGDAREHGWFGKNTLIAGSGNNALIGAAGHVKFVKGASTSTSDNLLYAGVREKRTNLHGIVFPGKRTTQAVKRFEGTPPVGTFYKFAKNGRVVAIPTPKGEQALTQHVNSKN